MKLEINGINADFDGVIAITKQSLNSGSPTDRFLNITNRITLPKTQPNKIALGIPDNINSTALDATHKAKIIDSYFLFQGSGALSEAGNSWKFQMADNSRLILDLIKFDINELDFEGDDFVYNSTNYNILKTLTDSVWVWSIVQMHEDEDADDLQYLRPHFSMWNIIKKSIESNGWTFSFDTDLIQNVAIQSNSEDFYFTSYQKTLTSNDVGDMGVYDFKNDGATSLDSIVLNNKSQFRVRGYITSVGESSISIGEDIIIFKDGTHYYDEKTSSLEGMITITTQGTFEFDNTLLYTIISEADIDDLGVFNPIGYLIKAYDNLPKLTQKKLLIDALVITNSIIISDNIRNNIEFKTLANFSTYNKLDWSEKYVVDSESIKSNIGNLAKKNNLTYENDIGKVSFNTDIDFLDKEGNYIELRYAGSLDKQNYATYPVYYVDSDGNNVRKSDSGLRIIYVDGLNGVFNPLSWTNLLSNYHSELINSLTKPREITAKFNLSKLDVIGFNPLQLVYVDEFSSNFIVEKINNYIPGSLTTVKLLRYGNR